MYIALKKRVDKFYAMLEYRYVIGFIKIWGRN